MSMQKIIATILEDLGLYVSPFKLTREHYQLSEETFNKKDLEKLLELATPYEEDNEDVDEARAMPIRTRAVLAASGGRGRPANVRRAMLRALAQKGFLIHSRYYPGGDKALIAAWKKFKQKGKTASKARVKRALAKGPPRSLVKKVGRT